MRKNTPSSKILRLFTITILGSCAFAMAEGSYQKDQPSGPQFKQDRQQSNSQSSSNYPSSSSSQKNQSYQKDSSGSDRSMSVAAKDAWIQGKLEATYAYNQDLSSFAIDTDVNNGVVHLQGNVESQTAKDLAEQLAMNTEGVKKVDNDLQIVPDTQG
ncbi:MAG TPA: BON domain-containing protein [Gammaproteobacteria bacterium]|nr:BON domain-containing protein [Gammaproteobacteria bacterium]